MEDRHSLSEPRLCPTASEGNLAWEVEVYRENVPEPIEILRIDNETLPPRMRKGKIVWRLPTEIGKLPNFGTDERRRIMELFKEKKKSRRKKKQEDKKSGNLSCSDKPRLNRVSSSISVGEKSSDSLAASDDNKGGASKKNPPSGTSKGKKKKENNNGLPSDLLELSFTNGNSKNKTPKKGNTPRKEAPDIIQNGGPSRDNKPQVKNSLETNSGSNGTTASSSDQPGLNHNQQLKDSSLKSNEPVTLSPTVPARRHFAITSTSLSAAGGATPTTLVAKEFISLYYPYLTHGLTNDLCAYYHFSSQKSISVGGAHSVVTGLTDIAMQVGSLSGCVFHVRGVVAQDTTNGDAHLLITGVCTPKGGCATAFAHSVGLVRVSENGADNSTSGGDGSSNMYKYLIQNDALSLLTSEMALAVEQQHQIQQQQQAPFQEMKQHHQAPIRQTSAAQQDASLMRPPGLFG